MGARYHWIFLALFGLFAPTACSFEKTGGGSTAPKNFAGAVLAAAQGFAQLATRVSYPYDVQQGTRGGARLSRDRASLAAFWLTTGAIANLYDTNDVATAPNMSAKSWTAADLDPAFLDGSGFPEGIFGRFSYLASIACVLTNALPAGSNGAPVTGTYPSIAVAFNGATASACGLPNAASSTTLTAAIQVTAPAITTNFDFSISISGDGLDNETLLGRLGSGGLVNLALFDDQTPGGHNQGTRLFYFSDPTSKVVRLEYFFASFPTDASSSFEIYRAYVDPTNNQGFLLGGLGSGDFSRRVAYTLAGPTTLAANSTLALSFAYTGQPSDSGGGTSAPNGGDACIDPHSGAIVSDSTLSCSVGGTESSAATALDGTVSAHSALTGLGVSETSAPAFSTAAGVYSDNG